MNVVSMKKIDKGEWQEVKRYPSEVGLQGNLIDAKEIFKIFINLCIFDLKESIVFKIELRDEEDVVIFRADLNSFA